MLDKKERQAQKQQRLKEMEEEFERERAQKLKQIDHKLEASEKNKSKNLQTIQKKLHQVSTRHQSVLSKIQTDVQNSLEKQIDSRKAYDSTPQDPLRTGSRLSRATDLSKPHSRQRFTKGEEDLTIDTKIFEINARLEKAKSISKERVMAAAQRIHSHNTSEIQSAQNKASRQLESQINNYSHKIASKFESVDINLERIESSMEKKQEEKQKMYSDKIRKYQDNIKYIQDQQLNKEEELNRKFVTYPLCRRRTVREPGPGMTNAATSTTASSWPIFLYSSRRRYSCIHAGYAGRPNRAETPVGVNPEQSVPLTQGNALSSNQMRPHSILIQLPSHYNQ